MDSYEDDLLLPLPEEPPSPIHNPKLKRLKKSSSSAAAVRVSDSPIVRNLDLPDVEKNSSDLEAPADPASLPPGSKVLGKEMEIEDNLDPLFSVPGVRDGLETLVSEREREQEEDQGLEQLGGTRDGLGKEKSVRKRLSLEEGNEEFPKKRKKKSKFDKLDGEPNQPVRDKRRLEKERKAHLDQIHAESQRLLRETRDVSFKPVPLVQKPISLVLEKIRLRKLEVLKKSSILCQSDSVGLANCSMGKIFQNSDLSKTRSDARDNEGDVNVDNCVHVVDVGSSKSLQDPCRDIPNYKASDVDLKDASPSPINDTQEVTKDYQLSNGENNQLDDLEDSPDLPLPTSNVNPDPDDLSSSEEDDDKENIDPYPSRAVNMDSSPKGGVAKAFLDDEAEEEDDSDHDLMRFEENEEDNDSDENEVLNDLIATGYEEAPLDHEKRNQLHQKWLEQQDAAGTDNILQRLKCGQEPREPTCLHDEDDDEEFGEESEDERSCDLPVTNVVRQNSKKAKQMIAQMFNDGDYAYVPSDDEESEQTLIRQHILKQTGEPSFTSPVEDEHSREIFGLIKKLNIAPATKKKGKIATSSFDTLVMGGNSNSSSKSSFLNRAMSNSLPSSHKGSTTVRTFIFGRDDSNSRSGISTSENISDMDPKENQPAKTAASTKFSSSSQFKSTASKMKIEANSGSGSGSGSSLFQILRHSSMHFDKQSEKKNGSSSREITESQATHQFSAFKLGKRVSKVESRF